MTEDLQANYAQAGFHRRQQWGKSPALLLIDFAQAYFDPACPLYGGESCQHALEAALTLREVAHTANIPVVLTQVKYPQAKIYGGAFFAKLPALACFEEGQPSAAFVAPLIPGERDTVVTKRYPSAFFGTDLASTLRWLGVDTLVLGGLTTSGCVRASCVDSVSHGFVTIVVEDAVGDRAVAPHLANLFDMDAKYADVVSSMEAVTYLKSCERVP
jgi:maleamate amidohydrolase